MDIAVKVLHCSRHGFTILASLTIAQAALESGWGDHAPGNNLFGIKAGNGWGGATQTLDTHEFINGQEVPITDTFRAYSSQAESVEDHAAFLAGLDRYKNIIGNGDAEACCRLIQADGYATEPSYADELIAIISGNNLTQYDALPAVTPADAVTADKQAQLNRIGIHSDDGQPLAVDGINGPKTKQAVIRLEQIMGLTVDDGEFGPQCQNAYNEITGGKPAFAKGSFGPLVKYMQYRLGGLNIDGQYGGQTKVAVMAFQQTHGLTVDGCVGPHTWAALV